uniref:Uncharacterized protein n=1 Tax=Aegilops tauschii subsp. strangulata TaxID=200361 RepID=A0A453QH79_AEGTS
LLPPLRSHRPVRGGQMATAALRFPPFLSSRAAPTTTAATCTRRTAPATLRVAALPDSASAPTSTSEERPEFSPSAGFAPPVPKRFAVKDGQLGSVAGAALALPFRLGTGLFVLGLVPSNQSSSSCAYKDANLFRFTHQIEHHSGISVYSSVSSSMLSK